MNENFEQTSAQVLPRLMTAYQVDSIDGLAEKMKVPSATIRTWAKRGGVPSRYCEKAAIETGVLLDWLVLGRLAGGSKRASQFDFISSLVNQSSGPGLLPLLLAAQGASEGGNQEVVDLPVYDCSGSCGPGNLIDNARVIDRIPVSIRWLKREGLHPDKTIIIGSKGDSMTPKIPPGSQLVIDLTKREPSLGGIFAFCYQDELFIKYLQRAEAGLWVSSEQRELHPPRLFSPEEAAEIRIEGRVHLVFSRV